jgi:hypothetical protein
MDSDSDVRRSAASALGQVAQADHTLAERTLLPLLNALMDSDPDVRASAASALGQVAQADTGTLKDILPLLTDFDSALRQAVREPLCDGLEALAEKQPQPVSFLLDHLEGRQSLMPGGDANTYAVYRDVVEGALARWLVSEKSPKGVRNGLEQELRRMQRQDPRLHLRVAAWNVFAEAAQLRDKQKQKAAGD